MARAIIKIGLIGCGSIGTALARFIDSDDVFRLAWVYDHIADNAADLAGRLKRRPKIAEEFRDIRGCRLVIEAASQEAVRDYALKVLDTGDLMVMSVGALSDPKLFSEIKGKAELKNRKVYIPSGAVSGIDGIRAAGMARISRVTLTTRKPPETLDNSPWVIRNDMSMKSIRKPTTIFEGTAKDAAEWFPKNINVSITLSLAGIGIEDTKVRIIADPFVKRNIHEIEAEGDFGIMRMMMENLHMPGNPRTSYLAALSAMATLKRIKENIVIGT